MVFDLRKALLRKEEIESAKLMEFAFRQRARATRKLARSCDLSEAELLRETAHRDEDGVIDLVVSKTDFDRASVIALFGQHMADARLELIAEDGDPAPSRMA